MNEPDVMVYLMTGFLDSGKDPVSDIYTEAGLLSDRWQDTSDPL